MDQLFYKPDAAEVREHPPQYKSLAALDRTETKALAQAVFGDKQGMELVERLGEHLGGEQVMLKRLIAMAYSSGAGPGQMQPDQQGGYHFGMFQFTPASTTSMRGPIGTTMDAGSLQRYSLAELNGEELYRIVTDKDIPSHELSPLNRDLIACIGQIYNEGGNIGGLTTFADPNLSESQVAGFINKINGFAPDSDYGLKVANNAENLKVDTKAIWHHLQQDQATPQFLHPLGPGDSGELVVRAQRFLGVHVTGSFDDATRDAVIKAREAAGLPPNGGIIDTSLWDRNPMRDVPQLTYTKYIQGASASPIPGQDLKTMDPDHVSDFIPPRRAFAPSAPSTIQRLVDLVTEPLHHGNSPSGRFEAYIAGSLGGLYPPRIASETIAEKFAEAGPRSPKANQTPDLATATASNINPALYAIQTPNPAPLAPVGAAPVDRTVSNPPKADKMPTPATATTSPADTTYLALLNQVNANLAQRMESPKSPAISGPKIAADRTTHITER